MVVPKYGLVGGGEKFVAELTERLASLPRYDIHVFANKWSSHSQNITFHKVPIITFPKWLATISFAYFANKKIASAGFDLIHAHDRIFKADLCSVHFIPHRVWIKEIRKKKRLSLFDRATCWVEKQMIMNGGCRMFMPVSSIAQQKMLDAYDIASEKIQIVHPGVDTEKFKPSDPETRLAIRHELGAKDDDLLILFVSMNFELKGLDFLMAALSRLREDGVGNQLKLLVVGKGNIKKYQDVARRLGIEENIIFTGVRHDMARIYQAGDLFVLLSGFDTFGMVVTEAMASGLPVIVSDKVGAKDLVRNGENGFVVGREDISAISARLTQMLDKQQRLIMGKMARRAIQENTWATIANKVNEVYKKLLSDSEAGRKI